MSFSSQIKERLSEVGARCRSCKAIEEEGKNHKIISTQGLSECCTDAYIRGAFLGHGSISDPQKGYHLEFITKTKEEALFLQSVLKEKNILSKRTQRKTYIIVYIKEATQIADLLGIMGDNTDAFELFGVQIEKDMRNNINRKVNCENANANKVAKAASRHLYAIKKIKAARKWHELPHTLKEIGELRCRYPEDSIKSLGERVDPPIGKSGVNHRLERILQIADML